MNQPDPIDGLTATTRRLGELVEQENALLKARKAHELARFQAEKERLAGTYERQMKVLGQNRGLLQQAPPGRVDALRQATKAFQTALAEHRRLVQATKAVTERMLKAIAREADARRRPVEGYTRAGTMRKAFPGSRAAVAPLALNQVI